MKFTVHMKDYIYGMHRKPVTGSIEVNAENEQEARQKAENIIKGCADEKCFITSIEEKGGTLDIHDKLEMVK